MHDVMRLQMARNPAPLATPVAPEHSGSPMTHVWSFTVNHKSQRLIR